MCVQHSYALAVLIQEFSAFKETSFRKVLESLLVAEDGSLRPWSEFKKEAWKVSGDYNHRWLETEYHQTVANANAARMWKDFGRNTDLYPNVKFMSVRDGRVRRSSFTSQIQSLSKFKNLKNYLIETLHEIYVEPINSRTKANKKINIEGYVKIKTKDGKFEICLEKNNAIKTDFTLYYIKKRR